MIEATKKRELNPQILKPPDEYIKRQTQFSKNRNIRNPVINFIVRFFGEGV